MGVSKNNGVSPNHPILIGVSIIYLPFWGVYHPYFWKHPYSWLENPPFWMLFFEGERWGGSSMAILFHQKGSRITC